MKQQVDPREIVIELAMKGRPAKEIQQVLAKRGFVSAFRLDEIEALVIEVEAGMNLVPSRPSMKLARCVGVIAIVMGTAGIAIGVLGSFHAHRYSPDGYGLVALILGVILVMKPSMSDTDFT